MMHFLEVSFGKNHIFVSKSVEFSARIRADFDVFVAGITKLKVEEEDARSKFAVRHLKCIFFRKATEGELFLSSPFFSPPRKLGYLRCVGLFSAPPLDHLLAAAKLKNRRCCIQIVGVGSVEFFLGCFFWGGIRDPRLHFGVFPNVNRSLLSIAGGGGGGGGAKREMSEIKASCCSGNRVTNSF